MSKINLTNCNTVIYMSGETSVSGDFSFFDILKKTNLRKGIFLQLTDSQYSYEKIGIQTYIQHKKD